jgi:hypothetical protein
MKAVHAFIVTQGCHEFTEGAISPNLWIGKDYSLLNATALSIHHNNQITSLDFF